MKHVILLLSIVAALTSARFAAADEPAPIAVAEIKHDAPVDFEAEILPIFRRNCLACHNAATHKSDLALETPQTISKGGASGATVEPGRADESLLLAVASHASEPHMPPGDNGVGAKALTPEELGLVKLWINQGATGEVKNASAAPLWQPLPPGVHPVLAVAISPDGQYAACGRANQIFIYHVPTQRLIGRLTDPNLLAAKVYENAGVAHLDIVQSLAFSPDGNLLASGGYREVKLWRRPEVPVLAELTTGGEVAALATSPDGLLTAVAGADGRVRIYAADNKLGATLVGHAGKVTAVEFVDGETLVTAGADGTLRRWRAGDGALLASVEVGSTLDDLAVLPGAKAVAAGCGDGMVRVLGMTGTAPRDLLAGVSAAALAVSPDQKLVAIIRASGPIDVLRLADGSLVKTLAGHEGGTAAIAFLADSLRVASAGADKTLKIWELERGQVATQVALGEMVVTAVALLAGDRVALGNTAGGMAIWTVGQEAPVVLGEAAADGGAVVGLVASGDAQTLFVARAAGQLAAVQVADAQVKYSVSAGAPALSLALSADGATVAVGCGDGQVRLLGAADGQAAAPPSFGPLSAAVASVALSADGRHLLAGSATGEVKLIDRTNGQVVQTLAAPNTAAARVAFAGSAGETALVAADGRLRATPVVPVQVLVGHTQAVTSVAAVAADANLLVSGSADGSVRMWDLKAGTVARQLDMGGPVTALAVRGDGQRIAVAGAGGTVRLWNAADGAQLAELQGDFRANQLVARLTTYLNLAKAGAEAADKALADARTAIETTEAEATGTAAALPPLQTAATDTATVAKTTMEAKDAATKLVADAEAGAKTATDAQAVAAAAATQATALATATGEAAKQATVAAEALAQAQTASAAALEKLKAAAATAPADAALQTAVAASEKTAGDAAGVAVTAKNAADGATQVATTHQAASQAATATLQAADAALATATAAVAAEKEKLAAADKAATEATAAAKTAADALAAATRKASDAEAASQRAIAALPVAETQAADLKATLEQVSGRLEAEQKTAQAHAGVVRTLAFSPDGRLLGAAGDSGLVQLYQGDTGAGAASFAGHAAAAQALAFAGNDALVTGSSDKSVRRFAVQPVWTLSSVIGPPVEAPLAIEHSLLADRVGALAFSPQGQLLATGGGEPSRSGELKLWNVADGALVYDFVDAHSDTVFGVDFSWDGRWLASCGADKFVKVWDTVARWSVRSYEGHTHHVLGVAWRWDGQQLASCGADGAVKVWGFESGEQIRTLGNFSKQLTGIHYVADTPQVITSGADAALHLLNTDDGKGVRNYGGASDFLYCVAVTANGNLVAAGGADGSLRIWTTADGKSVAVFGPPEADAAPVK